METMGRDERPAAAAVIDRLMRWPQGFNVFQALSLIERYAHHDASSQRDRAVDGRDGFIGTDDSEEDCVRIVGHISLEFSSSDIHSVSLETADAAPVGATACGVSNGVAVDGAGGSGREGPIGQRRRYVIRTPVMTLAGAQGPLPTAFTDLVLEREAAKEHATRDFLDIFNHRFLTFLYRSRKRHVLGLHAHPSEDAPLATCLRAIGALERGRQPWLRHAGLLCSAPRSISGLVTLLRDRLGVEVRAESLVGEWQALDPEDAVALSRSRGRLCAGVGAGRISALGRRAWQQAAGIRLELGPLSWEQLCSLLPRGERYVLLRQWVGAYIQMPLSVHLTLHPAPDVASYCGRLSAGSMPLGWRSWLSGSAAPVPVALRLHPVGEVA